MEVVFEVDAGTSDGEITFQYEHHYEITCSYLRVNMLQASFLPLHIVSSDDTGKWWKERKKEKEKQQKMGKSSN